MKIIWLSNVPFPDACNQLAISTPVVGGWMHSGAVALLNQNKKIQLAVISVYPGIEMKELEVNGIKYYMFPNQIRNNRSKLQEYFRKVYDEFKPNLSHIHGTEYLHSLAFANIANENTTIVSVQGLVSVYADYFLGGISEQQIKKTITVRDWLRKDSLLDQQRSMYQRGENEIELIRKTKHIIGRTSWDKANVWAINPNTKYHFCNESLREGFYKARWNYDNCEKHTIFLSQAHYPIKGLQQVIKALPLVLREYPDTKVFIAGNDITKSTNFKKNGFAKYIERLMSEYNVTDSFIFLGNLSEEEMIEQYLKANVFVCPSAIENSPNSVGEAQLLGTPVIASYTGGTMNMVQDKKTGFLYRFEEISLLAKRICELFESKEKCIEMSLNERECALERHNKTTNAKKLNEIYSSLIKNTEQ